MPARCDIFRFTAANAEARRRTVMPGCHPNRKPIDRSIEDVAARGRCLPLRAAASAAVSPFLVTSMSMRAARLMTVTVISSVCLGIGWPCAAALAAPPTLATGARATPGNKAAQQPGAQALDAPHAVVPPGQEEILSDILGRGVELPGTCKFAGAEADASVIRSTYACPKGAVVFELRHPTEAGSGATKTSEFAVTLKSGSPPAGLVDALASHIRSREAAFTWQWIGASPTR
jgi:hypothetical protein